MSDTLTVEPLESGVFELNLHRAPVNALSADFLMGFSQKIKDLEEDPQVRAIVLTSSFKVFSAGLDLKEAQEFDRAAQNAIVEGLNVGFLTLFACRKPTVCAVNGAAIAGGLFFVLGSDIRIASPNAKFGLAEVRVGADFPVGPLEIARATLDPNSLRRLMLTGQPIGADAALQTGMIDQITEDARSGAIRQAQMLADIPPNTYASVKRQIRGDTFALIQNAMENGANAPEGGWFNDETKAAMQRMIG